MKTEARIQTIRAYITDGAHPEVSRQGGFIRRVAHTDGWQGRLRGLVANLPPARYAGEIRLDRFDGVLSVESTTIVRPAAS